MKKIINQETKTIVDHQTGEVLSTEQTNVIRLPQEPPYVKMYLDDLSNLIGLKASLKDTLYLMLRRLDWHGVIVLSGNFRQQCCAELNIKESTLRNRIALLCRYKLLERRATNEYSVNPHYFARGDWKKITQRRESFKVVIEYNYNGTREISTGKA